MKSIAPVGYSAGSNIVVSPVLSVTPATKGIVAVAFGQHTICIGQAHEAALMVF